MCICICGCIRICICTYMCICICICMCMCISMCTCIYNLHINNSAVLSGPISWMKLDRRFGVRIFLILYICIHFNCLFHNVLCTLLLAQFSLTEYSLHLVIYLSYIGIRNRNTVNVCHAYQYCKRYMCCHVIHICTPLLLTVNIYWHSYVLYRYYYIQNHSQND